MVVGYLRFSKLNVISFSADLSGAERGRLLASFNDPECHVHALVVPSTMALTGMNMHQSCNWGVMIGVDEVAQKNNQAFARLHRINQSKTVHWFVIVQRSSYSRTQERSCHTKYVDNISLMSDIPMEITGDLRIMMCYEVVREKYGTVISLYAESKHIDKIESVSDYEAPWITRLAAFYSMLASLGLRETARTGDGVQDMANAIRLCERMQRLAPLLHHVCLLIERDQRGIIDDVAKFAINTDWDEIETYCQQVEGDLEIRKQSMTQLLRTYAKELVTAKMELAGGEGNQNELVREALKIRWLAFQPPDVPEAISDTPAIKDQVLQGTKFLHLYSGDPYEHEDQDDFKDREGLYDVLKSKPIDAPRVIFESYQRLVSMNSEEQDDGETAEERESREKDRERLDHAASIICDYR